MSIRREHNPQTTEYALKHHASSTKRANPPITSLDFLATGQPWPPESQNHRIQRYEKNIALWQGSHEDVYTDNFWKVLDGEKAASFELVFNWHKRLSTLWADLLLSEQPRFLDGTEDEEEAEGDPAKDPTGSPEKQEAASEKKDTAGSNENDPLNPEPPRKLPSTPSPKAQARQEQVDKISQKDDNGYVSTLYEIAIDISRFGDGVGKVTLDPKAGAEIWAINPQFWFPVVSPDNLRKTVAHVLAHEVEVADEIYLYAEVHTKGAVTRAAFKLDGNQISHAVPIESFTAHPQTEETGIDDFLVVPFHGLRTSDQIFGVDDYGDVDSIIAAIEKRAGQINKILDKHSDPSMYGPPDLFEQNDQGETVFKAGARYYEVNSEDGEDPPGYVVWEPHMEAQFLEIDTLLKQLYIISETSPAAFGQLEAGLVESGSALRRLMQAPLAKVARMTMRFDPAARRALQIACDLEEKHLSGPKIEKVQIQWQDGLPPDPKEQAETEKLRKEAGNTSLVSSIIRLDGGTEEEAEAELQRIEEEAQRQQHTDLQTMKAEGALEIAKVEAQAKATPPGSP